jgi:hypothetical protein
MLAVLLAGVAVVLAVSAHAADKKKKDAVWTNPDFASSNVTSIAMLPPVSFDRNAAAEKIADGALGAAVRGQVYRWLSATNARTLIASGPGGDSLLKVVRDRQLETGRVDSLMAPVLCKRTRTNALLSLRVDRWEQLQMEFNQAGKPSTTVQLTVTLVDSVGRLLWTASGSETVEGPYHDPNANVLGVQSSGLSNTPMTGQGGPPEYSEVLNSLLTRWAPQFPQKPVAAPAAAPASSP